MAHLGRWLFALIAVVALAGVVSPADAQVVVAVGGHGHRHHHHYHHHHR